MESFLISFHLNDQEDYAKVSEQIRSYPKWGVSRFLVGINFA